MSRPLPDHGTYARYTGRPASKLPGCRCTPCLEEGRRYVRRRDLLKSTGRPLTVPVDSVRAHLRALLDGGGGWNQVSAATGASSSTIQRILSGQQKTVRRSTEQRFLRVKLASVLVEHSVPALRAARQLRALRSLGHSTPFVASRSTLSASELGAITTGEFARIQPGTAAEVERLYDELAMLPGASKTVATKAQMRGWAPPLAWDDDTIGDPKAAPNWTGECGTRRGFDLHQTRPGLPAPCPRCVRAEARARAREARLAA